MLPAPNPPSLRIGLVTDCYLPQVGGIEMQVHDLARHLQRAGHDVVVITPTPGPDDVEGVRVHRIQVPLAPFNIPFTPGTFKTVSALLDREKVDVAHFHGGIVSPVAYVGANDAQRAGIPTVVTVHCLWSYATPGFRLLERIFRWGSWPVVYSAVSDVAARPIRSAAPGCEVLVLPNGIDHESWRVSPRPRDPSRVTIVSVMRLAPRKRPLHLLKMMKQVRDQVPAGTEVRLVVIGDGPERSSLDKYIAAHGLEPVIDLVGRRTREEIREVFATADLFVAPANLESFGIAALEARCAGLPVVAKARTGIREFVEHGQEGLLADRDRDMVSQIVRLVVDSDLREKIATFNREMPSPVDWDDVIEANVDAYQRAIQQARPNAGQIGSTRST